MSLAEARRVLESHWGYPRFRPGQEIAVKAALAGRDATVLLPTGSGKSLCYQVPAAVARRAGRGCTLVVSPLIALIRDQVTGLRGRGLRAGAVHSHQDAETRKARLAALRQGEYDLFYFSPERAAMEDFRYAISTTPVALLAIDEAHCVSQWGHDFRPDYLRLSELRGLVDAPIMALTATATPRVMEEIREQLQLRDPARVRGDFARPNLSFAVQRFDNDTDKIAEAIEILDAAGMRGREPGGRAIVYCATRRRTEEVAKALESAGFATGWYHAGRGESARQRAQSAFELRRTRVLVATNAFGMGVDLPDVRCIVHMQCPGSLEAYYQEAGRAGRDGAAAQCTLLFSPGDIATQRSLLHAGRAGPDSTRPHEDALATIERYAHGLRCRQADLCAHFSGDPEEPKCGRCDLCRPPRRARARARPSESRRDLDAAATERLAQALAGLETRVDLEAFVDALCGGRAKHLSKGALLRLPAYGEFADFDRASIVQAIEAMANEGKLRLGGFGAKRRIEVERARAAPSTRRESPALQRALDRFRSRCAREERVSVNRVFARRVITALDRRRPSSLEELGEIAGLDYDRIERYGEALLEILAEHG